MDNVIVFTDGRVFHAWDPNTTVQDRRTKCGRPVRYTSMAHHWGPRSMFAAYFTPCRRCFIVEDDE